MTDLVKRLRSVEWDAATESWMPRKTVNMLQTEAADRIEQLKAALRTLTTKLYADLDGGRKIRRYDVDRAAAALGEKEDD